MGVNVLTTLALMGLTAHVVAVGFQDWEPYRSWFGRRGIYLWFKAYSPVRARCITLDHTTKEVLEKQITLRKGTSNILEFPVFPDDHKFSHRLELPRGHRLDFESKAGYHVPTTFVMLPDDPVSYTFLDMPALLRCKVTVHWVG